MNALTQQPNFQPPPNPYQPYTPQPMNYQYQNPYTTPMQPTQSQIQQSAATKGFNGRYIGDISEVRLDEIPMTGQPCLFLTKDMTAIYLKVWNANGQLLTARYSLDQEQPQEPPEQDAMVEIRERLGKLEEAIAARTRKKAE